MSKNPRSVSEATRDRLAANSKGKNRNRSQRPHLQRTPHRKRRSPDHPTRQEGDNASPARRES